MKARVAAVAGMDDAVEEPDGIAGAFLGDGRAALDDERANAALGKGAGRGAAGEAGAEDDHRRCRRDRRVWR